MDTPLEFTPQPTADGSFTFYSTEFGEAFHSRHGARQEAQQKFVVPTQIAQKVTQTDLKLLDICYGLGYNTAAALETIWSINPHCQVEWIGLELNATVPQSALRHDLHRPWSDPIPDILSELGTQFQSTRPNLQAKLLLGDARQTLQQVIQQGFQADAIFLDPFSPPVCPQLWTVEFFQGLAQCLKPKGRLATYSCAASIRTALRVAGFQVGSTPPCGRRSPGTVASLDNTNLPPLSPQEQEHLGTRAAIPYHDPGLAASRDRILQQRQQQQQESPLEPTSHWKKRWQDRDSNLTDSASLKI